jgi:AIPR protein
MYEKSQLFKFMLDRVNEAAQEHSLAKPQAFARWFANLYFDQSQDVFISDGTKDGKVDLFLTTHDDDAVTHFVVNSKFTSLYNALSPTDFYDEIARFRNAFANKPARRAFLEKTVRPELRNRYKTLLERYDAGKARLLFITNHRRNDNQFESVKSPDLDIFHLEDIVQFMVDHIEGAMPRTPTMMLSGIRGILSADKKDTEVSTSIVFARLSDFLSYMRKDPYDLLFARNVRLSLGNTAVNKDIRRTFEDAPHEFAYSNNGITMLCEKQTHHPSSQELHIVNPRIVNGSQTLHSIKDAENTRDHARVMVRIIEVPPINPSELSSQSRERKELIQKISVRSNLQNPIKKWNLVSNDEYQQLIARFFWKKRLYYERRSKEWNFRRTELKSRGIKKGPDLKFLTQLVASAYWNAKQLGPATAKSKVSDLFEDKPYATICRVRPEEAYQIYLLNQIIEMHFDRLSSRKRYIKNFGGHITFCLLSLIVKISKTLSAPWGRSEFTSVLEQELKEGRTAWEKLIKTCIDRIRLSFSQTAKQYRAKTGSELNYNNFFKNQAFMTKVIASPLSSELKTRGRNAFRPA